jgi:septum formation inhibitor MinC
LLQKNLRSGQAIRYEGSVVILGDVNPGAEVVAPLVMLWFLVLYEGLFHAGAAGDDNCYSGCQYFGSQLSFESVAILLVRPMVWKMFYRNT